MTMSPAQIPTRIKSRFRREVSKRSARRCVPMRNETPLVSFTFDDFPRSALLQGGEILSDHGLKGTFFRFIWLNGAGESDRQDLFC